MKYRNPQSELTRVAIVDDSRSIRAWLRHVMEADPRLKVVGEAGSGVEARALLRHTKADVMTLDVDMPGISGIDFLARLMAHRPMPVVMISSYTEDGGEAAVKALSLGAVDCIEKPRFTLNEDVADKICDRVFQASQVTVHSRTALDPQGAIPPAKTGQTSWTGDVFLIGASTGGVTALETLLAEVDGQSAPVIIAQHMPENFLQSFCKRLNENMSRRFLLAKDGVPLKRGQGILALGKHVSTRLEVSDGGEIVCRLGPPSETAVYRPCIDDLFRSAARARLTGAAVLLTGMGQDGAKGLLALKDLNWRTFAQDEASSVVFGMPKSAIDLGAVDEVAEPGAIGRHLASLMNSRHHLVGELPT